MDKEYDFYFNKWLLEENKTELIKESFSSILDDIIRIIKRIISYIKNLHPIKRHVIKQLLDNLNASPNNGDFTRFNNLIQSSFTGLMHICNYNLKNLLSLEESMFDLYNKFGSNPNPSVIKNNIFLKFEINSSLNNYIYNKVKEYCKDHELIYSRHNIITVNAKSGVITITVIIYDINNNSFVESFRYNVNEKEIKDLDYDINTKRLAIDLLKSHLSSLDKFRWVTDNLDKKLKENLQSSDKTVINISKAILDMVNNLNDKFYIISVSFAKDCLK